MKRFLRLSIICVLVFVTAGCRDILNEQPRAKMVPSYFKTANGLRQGLTAAYSYFRFYYGTEGGMAITVLGTDMWTTGGMANSAEIAIDNYTEALNPSNAQFQTVWNRFFTAINTTNGVIQFGKEATGLPAEEKSALLGQAHYLRAAYYFILVQMFGGVPLDLGSGDLKFNTNPVTTSERDSVSTVYSAIIQDLKTAMEKLPNIGSAPGRADKAAAMFLLSKVYLTRGWNEKANQNGDFQKAFDLATRLIENRGQYGLKLEKYFIDVNAEGNENGPEVIWNIQHTENLTFNESDVNAPANGLKENRSNFFFHPYYEVQTVTVTVNGKTKKVNPVKRTMKYQRPWIRFRPTEWLLQEAFTNRKIDSRFDVSFRTVWLCNKEGVPGFNVGDTAFYMPGHEVTQAFRDAHKYRIWEPGQYEPLMYPDLRKFDDTNREDIQYSSTRPFIVYKLSAAYFIAAEAAIKMGQPGKAVEYLNIIRRRAAYRKNNTTAENRAAAQKMKITVGKATIEFVLEERARELAGEMKRWLDLKRTETLIERTEAHNPDVENIDEHFLLRPVPQSQIDAMTGENAAEYQNPGYD